MSTGRRRRRRPVDRRHDVRRFRRRGLRGGSLEPARRRRRARPASARAGRLGDRPGLGGQPRLADLRARGALDGLLVRVRGDLLDAVHPAQPRRARHRAARRRLRVPPHRAARSRAVPLAETPLRARVGAHAVLPGNGGRRDRRRPRAGRQRGGRHGDELAQSALARDRRALRGDLRLPRGGVPRQRRAARGRCPTSSGTSPTARSSPPSPPGRSPSAGLVVLHRDARYIFDGLTSDGLPLVIVSLLCGIGGARAASPRRPARRPSAGGRRRRRRDLGLGRRAVALPPAARS